MSIEGNGKFLFLLLIIAKKRKLYDFVGNSTLDKKPLQKQHLKPFTITLQGKPHSLSFMHSTQRVFSFFNFLCTFAILFVPKLKRSKPNKRRHRLKRRDLFEVFFHLVAVMVILLDIIWIVCIRKVQSDVHKRMLKCIEKNFKSSII